MKKGGVVRCYKSKIRKLISKVCKISGFEKITNKTFKVDMFKGLRFKGSVRGFIKKKKATKFFF